MHSTDQLEAVPQAVLELEPGSRAEEWHQHPLGGGWV